MDSLLDHDRDYLRPPWGPFGRDLTLGLVSLGSKLVLQVLNSTRILDHELYTSNVLKRRTGVGLLTISNHTSTFDDPGLPCAMLPWHFFWTEHIHGKTRWTMCASDICFKNELFRQFFLNGKTLPVERGAGVAQTSVGVAARALAAGDWLHIFPEGRVTPNGSVGPFKQGIGRLVCDARAAAGGRDPIILPYFHSNMARIMPFKSSIPHAGHTVHVAIGQPLDITHITCRCNQPGEDQQQVWRDIAVAMRHAVLQLESRVPPNANQVLERPDVAAWEARYQEKQRQQWEQPQQHDAALRQPQSQLVLKQDCSDQQQPVPQDSQLVHTQQQQQHQHCRGARQHLQLVPPSQQMHQSPCVTPTTSSIADVVSQPQQEALPGTALLTRWWWASTRSVGT